jgi:hypothetical protein
MYRDAKEYPASGLRIREVAARDFASPARLLGDLGLDAFSWFGTLGMAETERRLRERWLGKTEASCISAAESGEAIRIGIVRGPCGAGMA